MNNALDYKGYREPRQRRSTWARVKRRQKMVITLAKKRVSKDGRKYPLHCSANAIRQELQKRGITVTKQTVWRDTENLGMDCRVRKRVPTREPAVIDARLKFSSKWLRKSDCLKRMVWSDEHTVSINDHTCRTMYVDKNDEIIPRERRRLHNIPRTMVWAAVGIGFKSPIIIFPEKAVDAEGQRTTFHLNGDGYIRRCLSVIVPKLLAEHRIFQQDGAKPHQNNRVRAYLEKKGVEYIEKWPSYSPDMNMIELVWPVLNQLVAEQHPSTMQELQTAVRKAWKSIPQDRIDAICKGFKNKLGKVKAKDGRC